MATQVFLLLSPASTHRGDNTANLRGTNIGWLPLATGTSRGDGVQAQATNTVAGTTPGVEVNPAVALEWLTPPIDQDVTISGAVTGNIWASESNMSANVAINFVVDKISAVTPAADAEIVRSARTTEVAVTTRAVNNFTATPGGGIACNKGDRLRIRIFGDDAGTMASGFTFSVSFNGTTAAADGDTYIQFTETFGFQTTDPTGTTLYLTNNASAVATADIDYEAWTSRGDADTQTLTTPGVGWRAPFQLTETSGGTAISWFTRPLQAFTLSGLVKCNIRARESASTADASIGVEIARVNNDGTNANVWGYANRAADTTSGGAGELATSETAYTIYVSGDDLSVSTDQRLRIRVFFDDCADIPAAGGTVSIWHDGPTGEASGDTFLIFGQTLIDNSAPGVGYPFSRVDRSFGLRDTDPWSSTGWRA